MFFAPSQIIKGRLLLDEYNRYQQWYHSLPAMVASVENAPAHVISLHLYYHVAVLLLFRPFLRAKFTESDLVPSEICRVHATAISDLFARYMSMYHSTGIYTFQLQCLLAACTIHLINLPAISSAAALRKACEYFHALVSRNTWAFGSIKLLKDLVTKWGVILPVEVEEALYHPQPDLPPSVRERFDDPAAPQTETIRGAKRAAFLNPASQVLMKRQRLAPVPGSTSGQGEASSGSSSSNTPAQQSGGRRSSSSAQQESQFLFAPFPNQAVPLLGPIHTSTSADTAWSEELSRVAQDFDGLRFEGDGWFDPFIGF